MSLLHKRYPPTDPEATDCDSDNEDEFVKQSFPRLTPEFSEVATPSRIKVIVFDIFGVLLVRGICQNILVHVSLKDLL